MYRKVEGVEVVGNKRYTNLNGLEDKKSFGDLWRWRKERKGKVKDFNHPLPLVEEIRADFLHKNRQVDTLTWIGHATFLIQLDGLNIVTDPLWANRMGFEKRLVPPGLSISQMPPVDVVLLSHAHYDHLDFPSIKKLKGNPIYLVPMGMSPLFRKRGLTDVKEFSWWEREKIDGVDFTFVPAQHWSKRTPFDTNQVHWGGWVMEKGGRKEGSVYFAGDTGYFAEGFREIGQRHQPEVALLPIGAYEPEWFMGFQHLNPEEAIQAFSDLGSRYFVPMHYGTFRLADDTPYEALARLQAEWTRRGFKEHPLKTLKIGETLEQFGI